MKALVVGAGMTNKGAELMLRTLVSETSRRFPEIALGLSPAIPNYRRARRLGLARLAVPLSNPGHRYRFPLPFFLRRYFPRWMSGATWRWSDVDMIIDISGFAYTDQWGTAAARNLARMARDVSSRGGHVYLLPQSFGPFNIPGHAAAMREVLEHADLVFARDVRSREYLEALDPPRGILLAPDITLSRGFQPPEIGNWVALVPNIRLMDQGRENWGQTYVSTMVSIIDKIARTGLRSVVVVHDQGGGDASLAEKIISSAKSQDVDILTDTDPMSLKKRLATAQFVVASRFHALASSLSCDVPVLALGWSHKYRALLTMYDLEDFCFDAPSVDLHSRLNTLLEPSFRQDIRRQLRRRNRLVNSRIEDMWEVIRRNLDEVSREPRLEAN